MRLSAKCSFGFLKMKKQYQKNHGVEQLRSPSAGGLTAGVGVWTCNKALWYTPGSFFSIILLYSRESLRS